MSSESIYTPSFYTNLPHTMNGRTPYTYLIGWSKYDIWYYGSKYAKGCHPKDLWRTYFTSSRYVSLFIKDFGDPDIIQIRKVFDNIDDAQVWEQKVLTRLHVKPNPKWLNMSENSGKRSSSAFDNFQNGYFVGVHVITNEKFKIHSDDPRVKMGLVIHNTTGTKTSYDTVTKRYIRIPKEQKYCDRFISPNKDKTVVRLKGQKEYFQISKFDFDPEVHERIQQDPYERTPEMLKAMSERVSGDKNPMYGKPGTFSNKTHSAKSLRLLSLTKATSIIVTPFGNFECNYDLYEKFGRKTGSQILHILKKLDVQAKGIYLQELNLENPNNLTWRELGFSRIPTNC